MKWLRTAGLIATLLLTACSGQGPEWEDEPPDDSATILWDDDEGIDLPDDWRATAPAPPPPDDLQIEGLDNRRAAPAPPAPSARHGGPTAERDHAALLAEVDQVLKQLAEGHIVFNTPTHLNLKETTVIQLRLSPTLSPARLREGMTADGRIDSARIRIAPRMEARLTGVHFDIQPITPAIQAVSAEEVTEWRWQVQPLRPGEHTLHLTLNALIEVDGRPAARALKTFERPIRVYVTWPQRAQSFLSEHWKWLWATLLMPLAGWLWQRRRRHRASSPEAATGEHHG